MESTNANTIFCDVLICGAGPTGYMSALTLARYGITDIRIIDQRQHTTLTGHAAGIQPRTIEVLQSLDLLDPLDRAGDRMYESAFYAATPEQNDGKLTRTNAEGEVKNKTPFQFGVVCPQSIVEDKLDTALRQYGVQVDRPAKFLNYQQVGGPDEKYPLSVEVEDGASHATHIYRTQYLLACDGSHSGVVQVLGFEAQLAAKSESWVVADCYVETDFPDIRRRCPIRSPKGALQLIPLPGERVRIYTELNQADIDHIEAETKAADHRIARGTVQLNLVQRRLDEIMAPYSIRIGQVDWISNFPVRQRIMNQIMDKSRRIICLGDACHSHSPTAAQGMNTGLNDAYNLTWKLALVLQGLAPPALLDSYQVERHQVAEQLIDHDKKWSELFVEKSEKADPKEFLDFYRHARGFTSGIGIRYNPGETPLTVPVVGSKDRQPINTEAPEAVTVGLRLLMPHVIRHIDGAVHNLINDLPSFGRFHLFVFAGSLPSTNPERLKKLCTYLESSASPLQRYTSSSTTTRWHREDFRDHSPAHGNTGRPVDLVVLHTEDHLKETANPLPPLLAKEWAWRVYEDEKGSYHKESGVDEKEGAVVLVRPDGYVTGVAALDEVEELGKVLEGILSAKSG